MNLPSPPCPMSDRPDRPAPARLRGWLRDTSGALAVEAVIVLPALIGAFLALLVFYDAFRTQKVNVAASYTLSDLLSRQVEPVTPDYIDSLHDIYDYMTRANHPTSLRVSSVYWNVIDEEYQVVWSYATRDGTVLTDERLNQDADRLPVIPRSDTVILMETRMHYSPPIIDSMGDQTFAHFVVTRPRFAPQVVFDSDDGGEIALTPCQHGEVTCGW
ncbi:MAG: hypothetical protein HLUCCA12_06800 [Rhodobacteraceae bacterium HLUCCA12]|nr:MAG: hypothetical protein HLUCCA12_06800 [Rhodobacteraceae bacterium HLUCCA12]